MGYGNYLKKISHTAGNIFKKVEHGALNAFKKTADTINKIPSFANQVGNVVQKVGNAIQQKSDVLAPILSSGLFALGNPALATSVLAGQQAISNVNKAVQNKSQQAQQFINDKVSNFNNSISTLLPQ